MQSGNVKLIKSFCLVLLILSVIGMGHFGVAAQAFTPDHNTSISVSSSAPDHLTIDPDELTQFMDRLVAERMDKYAIPGYSISVVQDGKIIFAKGYGFANVEETVPVEVDQTLFRIGSVSKLFVWTAVMQLVEQNRLDLKADVDTYLGEFQIPDTFPMPITLAHLLTHTAGFDKRDQGELSLNSNLPFDLSEYIQNDLPKRILPPGKFHIYSNYGTNLAAYIVEQVTGMPFEVYVAKNILDPLGMSRSTFQQFLPPVLAGDMAAGYYWQTGFPAGQPGKFEILSPSGAMSTTAVDMARFMLAHLGTTPEGSLPVLRPETLDLMHTTHFQFDARLPGYTYGFFESAQNGQSILSHTGGTTQFSGSLMLIPEQNIGLFEAYSGGMEGSGFLDEDFIDHYFSTEEVPTPQPAFFDFPNMRSFRGIYRTTLFSRTTFEKTIQLLNLGEKVKTNDDGTLNFRGSSWIRIDPLTFQKEGGSELLMFKSREGANEEKMGYLLVGNEALEKLGWYESMIFQLGFLAAFLLIFFIAILALPASFLVNWKKAHKTALTQLVSTWMCWFASAVNVAFIASFALLIFTAVWYGFNPVQKAIFILPFISPVLCTASIAIMEVNQHSRKAPLSWTKPATAYILLISVVEVGFMVWLNYWNLLGIPF